MELGFNLQLYETSRCTGPDGRDLLIVEMTCNRLGVWRVEVREIGGRTIDVSYATETEARQAVELAYDFGRQNGRWHIQRSHGYEPDVSAGPVSPEGIEEDRLAWEDKQEPRAERNVPT